MAPRAVGATQDHSRAAKRADEIASLARPLERGGAVGGVSLFGGSAFRGQRPDESGEPIMVGRAQLEAPNVLELVRPNEQNAAALVFDEIQETGEVTRRLAVERRGQEISEVAADGLNAGLLSHRPRDVLLSPQSERAFIADLGPHLCRESMSE